MSNQFFVFGLNHATAAIQEREEVSLNEVQQKLLIDALLQKGGIQEVAVLATCNRLELYGVAQGPVQRSLLLCCLGEVKGRAILDSSSFYCYQGKAALEHLFRVASALDSQIVGETHILGQVKACYQQACRQGAAGRWLNEFFQRSFQVAKKVRNQTDITALPISEGSCAVALVRRIFGDLPGRRVLIVGVGEIGRTVAKHFAKNGVQMQVSNRTPHRAQELASVVEAEVVEFSAWKEKLRQVDIAVFATSTQQTLLGREAVRRLMKARKHRPLLMLDLGVPRNVDAEVSQVDSLFLYNIDDVQSIVDSHYAIRLQEAEKAHTIILQSAQWLWQKMNAQQADSAVRSAGLEVPLVAEG